MSPSGLAGGPREEVIPRLFSRHGGRIYRLGLKLCQNPDAAEDLVQETFLLAFRKWDQFEGRSDPSTWLYTIAARVCRRQHRLRAGEPRHMASLSALLPSRDEGVLNIPSRRASPHEILERREARETVERAIAGIPANFRLPLVLKDLEELSLAEIARILGLKVATVKTRLHRARLAVARELAKSIPKRSAPAPDHSRRVCLDLLHAKQEALDRGVRFPVASRELCARCRSLFTSLDLAHDACRRLERGDMPRSLRQAVLRDMRRAAAGSTKTRRRAKKSR